MPLEPKRHCPRGHKAYFGRRCPECEKKRNEIRGSGAARGYDAEWRRFRLWFIKLNPMCCVEDCGEKTTDVDHIKSLVDGGGKLDPENCRPFCHRHHSQRTGRDQVKVGRKC